MEKTITKKQNNKKTDAKTEPKIKTAHASARFLRLSPRKVRLVTNMVKGMWAVDALTQLQFVNKKPAIYVSDVIKSAIANGVNNFGLRKEGLYIKSITCDSGPKLKRYMPRAQGKASEIRRPLAHINVLLEERSGGSKNKFQLEFKSRAGKAAEEKTTKQDAAEDKNKPGMQNQIDKSGQDVKRNKITQKRRLFNRKSGV